MELVRLSLLIALLACVGINACAHREDLAVGYSEITVINKHRLRVPTASESVRIF
ncbi:MAG: hypothetical protein OYH77_06845 [Pseudomonadota bacterium]|nr:hypothetical protein [Pseudomonadota bacterium]